MLKGKLITCFDVREVSWRLFEDTVGCSEKNEGMEEILLKQLKKQLRQLWQL
jgi:hypothetical protein